jgi:signal transduction histidine kinase
VEWGTGPAHGPRSVRVGSREPDWRWFALRIVLPSVLVILSFITLLFAVLIPTLEESLLARKREMTSELTNSAWSILAEYEKEVTDGRLTMAEAQASAIERIKYLRYGAEGKDYFWITDMHPRMVMHPYRPDLDGQELTGFTDQNGVRLFVEFATMVRERDHGYVNYVWQWKDDPDRLEAKQSYVRGFTPWGWVIGTGIYVEDVRPRSRP